MSSDLQAAVVALIDAANEQKDPVYSDAMRAALNHIAHRPAEEHPELRGLIAEKLKQIESPIGAGLIAVWFGSAVENGVDPKGSGPAIVETMHAWMKRVPTDDDDAEPNEEITTGLQYLGQALVAHLARSPVLKTEVCGLAWFIDELERVEHVAIGAHWVFTLVRQTSGDLVVLHGEQPVGVRVRYENLTNCFHLFTLLQAAVQQVMPGAQKTSDEVLAAATGRAYQAVEDQAWWHFGQGDAPAPELGASIWGEASPHSIVRVDGTQVMLLWPGLLGSRGWGSNFFAPFLQASPPSVTVTTHLTPAEVDDWRTKIGL